MEDKDIINENQEIKEENPIEEAPVEEVSSSEEHVDELDQSIEIKKPDPNGKTYGQVVEEERLGILAQSKKSSRLSTISIIVVMGLAIGALILLLNNIQIVAYILMGTALLTLIVFSIVIRRIARPDARGYIFKASTAINEFTFADNRFTNVKYDPTDKIQLEDIANDGVYKDLKRVASRNVCEGLFNGRSFKVCEAAFFKPIQGRKENPAFIGKYLTMTNDLHFEGRIVLIKKGENDTDLPDALDDLKEIDGKDKFFAYGADEKSLKEIDKKFVQKIRDFDVSKHLMNLTVIIWAGRTIVYASYDDATITLPFYGKYEEDTAIQYRDNLIELIEAGQLLLKE